MTGIFSAGIAVVYLALRKYKETKDPPWLFLILANSISAIYFFLHALVVPDFLIFSEALFDIFEHYGLFLGGIALLIGVFFHTKDKDRLYHFHKRIISGWIAGNLLFVAFFTAWPRAQDILYSWVDYATGVSGVFLLLSALFFFRRFYVSREQLNIYVANGLLILVASTILPFFYEEWNLVWWSNHSLFLLGNIAIFVGFIADHKREVGKKGDIAKQIPFYRRVRFKLAVLILILTTVPLSLLGVYGSYITEQSLRKQAISALEIMVKANDGHVDRFLQLLERTAVNFSSDGLIRQLSENASLHPEEASESATLLNRHLIENKLPLDQHLVGINILDTSGKVISSTYGTEIGKDESEDEYFTEGMRLPYGKALTIDYGSSSHFDANEPLIATVSPLFSLDGSRMFGVIVTYFRLDGVTSIINKEIGQKNIPDVYLVNSNNLLISESRFLGKEAILSQVVDTEPVRNCRKNQNASGLWTDWRGEKVYGASICFTDFPFRWTLVAEIDEAEVIKPATTFNELVTIFVLLLTVVVIFIALVSARGTVDSLRKLSHLAGRINQGDLESQVDINSTNEIGELAKNLDTMRQTIKKREGDLRQTSSRLEEASGELHEKMSNLEESKKAMINLLDDAKILEEQLDTEKKDVERKIVERTRELKEEQARLLASINSLSFGFIIADMQHQVLLKNNAMTALFGLKDNDEISIDRISELLGEHFNVKSEVEKCLKSSTVCEIKEIIFGTKFLRGIVAPVLTQETDEIIGYVLLFEDITEAKVIERSREEFFAVASHELRTPLTAIRGNSEMIQDLYKDKIVDKDMSEMIADIHEASVRLIGIVNDFLDTSQLEQGKSNFRKESVDLLPILRETCKEIEPLAEAKNLSLIFIEPTEALPLVSADQVRIKQAISNLIDNAVKYTEKGTVTVTIERMGTSLAVSVQDTGKGISPENQSLLFRKFQQAGEEMLTRDVSKSTGLGLYISKLVVERMGGTVGLFKSALGEGSIFRLTIPIAPSVQKNESPETTLVNT